LGAAVQGKIAVIWDSVLEDVTGSDKPLKVRASCCNVKNA
jgi:hypothetical protein